MEAAKHRIEYQSRSDVFHLYPLGDIHAGTVYCAERAIKEQVRLIANDPLSLWVGMGDYADCITSKDPRWDSSSIASWVPKQNIIPAQENWVYDLFLPIRDKCIGLIEGNHECTIRAKHDHDIAMNLCARLKVKYLGYSAIVSLIFSRKGGSGFGVKGFFSHGSGGPNTDGGKINNLVRALNYFPFCDIWVKGHIHDIKVHEQPAIDIDNGGDPEVIHRNRCAAASGSWFYTYRQHERPSYAEIKGYAPNRIGCPVFTITPDKKRINVYSHSEGQ